MKINWNFFFLVSDSIMYNGIGLQTPRGSGTNGYVQRNMSFVPKVREKVNYRTEDDIKKLDALANKKPNEEILAHEKKRIIELKCFEMRELMEEQGYVIFITFKIFLTLSLIFTIPVHIVPSYNTYITREKKSFFFLNMQKIFQTDFIKKVVLIISPAVHK